ncbi:BETAA-AD [Symbiodinium natans]|uniref:BETAA-AD protein n=1 Tax=Symbiodinium natans TaxID=878477 RepID=A0A812LET1_9DINO|nr:BETAA-AD [Symbiodinium natans]
MSMQVFAGDFKQFFCRYNEPSYIKQVKIDILTMLADFNSAEHVVTELSEYVTDVDAEIARRAIRAIGKIAVHVPSTSEMIVTSLTGLLELDIDYVCTEAAVVMKDLVRKYPEQFQQASGAVQKCLRIVTEPDGKSALLWILGEYGLLIEDAPYLLEPMIDSFTEESGAVQLEMLTAAVKLFFCRPPEVQKMLGCLMQKAIQECAHPDVRDRALLYYRLLQVSPEEARRVICAPKEVVEEFQEEMDVDLRDRVFDEFNSLSTVYKQPASKFIQVSGSPFVAMKMQPPALPEGMEMPPTPTQPSRVNGQAAAPPEMLPDFASPAPAESADLLGGGLLDDVPAPVQTAPKSSPSSGGDLLGMEDLLGGLGSEVPVAAPPAAPPEFSLAMDASMDGNSFQARWSQLPQLPVLNWPMRPGSASNTGAVEAALRPRGIFVIASGTVGQSMKFYFYARQAGPTQAPAGVWFLLEVIMALAASSCQVTLKVDNAGPTAVDQFQDVLRASLAPFLV